jgi:hypothetical protein
MQTMTATPVVLSPVDKRPWKSPGAAVGAGRRTMNVAGVKDPIALVPTEFSLSQNYPNPFSEKTTVKFCVAYRTRVTLEIFTAEGKKVQTLVDEVKDPGTYEVECVARGGYAPTGKVSDLPEGVYVCRLQAGDFVEMKEMIVRGHYCSPTPSPHG